MNRTGRYHREVFFPSDFKELFKEYYDVIYAKGPLTFSLHSVVKLSGYMGDYGKLFLFAINEIVTEGALEIDGVFEFYTNKEGFIEKSCIRYSFKDAPVDIVLVISRSGVIITCYTIDKNDTRNELDKRMYVKKERK